MVIVVSQKMRNIQELRTFDHTFVLTSCMRRRDCHIVNYNTKRNSCLLSKGVCLALQRDSSFQVNWLGTTPHRECLQWQPPPPPVSGNTTAVTSHTCHQTETCSVGRLRINTHVVPGKYFHGRDDLWSVLNGVEVGHGVKEILTVNHNGQVAWMPFRAGDTLPVGAVAGGHLGDNGSLLYVMRATAGSLHPFGYYNPLTVLGYLPQHGVVEVTNMDILVLLWNARAHTTPATVCLWWCDMAR